MHLFHVGFSLNTQTAQHHRAWSKTYALNSDGWAQHDGAADLVPGITPVCVRGDAVYGFPEVASGQPQEIGKLNQLVQEGEVLRFWSLDEALARTVLELCERVFSLAYEKGRSDLQQEISTRYRELLSLIASR